MARTTAAAVQTLLGGDYQSSLSVTPFIDSATLVVDRVSTCATGRGVTLSSEELELIERWYAAYLYTRVARRYRSKQTGKASATYEDTTYLDGAYGVDASGCLKAIIAGRKTKAVWLGKRVSEQTDYINRD